jgi:hypothetical protein
VITGNKGFVQLVPKESGATANHKHCVASNSLNGRRVAQNGLFRKEQRTLRVLRRVPLKRARGEHVLTTNLASSPGALAALSTYHDETCRLKKPRSGIGSKLATQHTKHSFRLPFSAFCFCPKSISASCSRLSPLGGATATLSHWLDTGWLVPTASR